MAVKPIKPGRAAAPADDTAACPSCSEHEHLGGAAAIDAEACERAAAIFRALGDPQRLRILVMLEDSERCVSELCQALQDNMPAISQRLRLLKAERIVRARRDGKHIYYALADNHIARLVTNGLLHALEQSGEHPPDARVADRGRNRARLSNPLPRLNPEDHHHGSPTHRP